MQAEMEARALYEEAATHCHSVKDYVTRDLFEELMHDEEEHIDFLETQVDLIGRLGRFAALLPALENQTPVEAMAWRLRTPHGKQLYGLRKQTPEPVFGIIKSVIGFRQFLLRGLDRVRGEWSLVTMAWNIKRMYALSLG